MIDFHCHILPNIDDGADFPSDALRMARIALEENIIAIVTTPHYVERKYDNSREEILEQFHQFRTLLQEHHIPLQIYPGCEIALTPEVPSWLESGRLLTINDAGRYLLLELPFIGFNPAPLEEVLDYLPTKGITPIIAHPERCHYLLEHPKWLIHQVERGALVQLNTQSITDDYEEEIKTMAEFLLRNDLVHLIGTDAHSADRRPPVITAAKENLIKLVGEAKTKKLLLDNPSRILSP